MFCGSSPKKRKMEDTENEEISDSNWNDDNENSLAEMDYDDIPSCSTKPPTRKISRSQNASVETMEQQTQQKQQEEEEVSKLDRVREIISREFKREMKAKEMQLEQIDVRLDEAKNLLERLRYAIVVEYYKKQEQQQTMIDAAASMRGESDMMNERDQIPQIPLHPSVQKIIGKRPKTLAEIMRACPKREAAKNAQNVLYSKSSAERLREERRLQKVIREKGIVIDHSKQVNIKTESETITEVKSLKERKEKEQVSSRLEESKPHVLNRTRTSNKQKCHFVVGNTSKYIGKNSDGTQSNSSTSLSYKWLVYVQTKDADVPIGKYIKKVRFFLHPSYRPNDVVDIHEAPFQVARRGWGEFPMRIQLFFHDKFQQKPLQLVHKVVLDITKSGRHTLGAETVIEVWLKNEATSSMTAAEKQQIKLENSSNLNTEISTTTSKTTTITAPTTDNLENHRKPRTISLNIKETFDDNFLDFLNKIEGSRTQICEDIEKIEPTLLVNEPLEPKFSHTLRSPIKKEFIKSPVCSTPSGLTTPKVQIKTENNPPTLPRAIKDATTKLFNVISQSDEPKYENQIFTMNPISSSLETKTTHSTTTATSNNNSSIKSNNSKDSLPDKIFNNSSGTVILPLTQPKLPLQQAIANSSAHLQSSLLNKVIFQKKTLQIVNAQGLVKTIQMLVPSSNSSSVNSLGKTISVAGKLITTKPLNVNASGTPPLGSASTIKNSVPTDASTTTTNSSTTSAISTSKAPTEILKQISTQHQSNSNSSMSSTTSSRNIVFQKEGKLYIIDPTQIKLKQQQKKENQISLLKPQVKQQTRQANSNLRSIASDHDYTPPPTSNMNVMLTPSQNSKANPIRTPELHFGMREQRRSAIKVQDNERLQRIQFEGKFNDMNFDSMRTAVEFLLRRLPLIETDITSSAGAFPFVRKTAKQFHSLPAFKQRCFEWLRAKFIASMLQKFKSLQSLHTKAIETYWSTREIATFARFFGYTPPIKALKQEKYENASSKSKDQFTSLIKTEMKSEKLQLEYETLTPSSHIIHWMENIQKSFNNFEFEETILIDDDDDNYDNDNNDNGGILKKTTTTSKDIVTKRIYGSPLKNNCMNLLYLPTNERLETAFELVGEVCRDISIRLRPEEIIPGILHPTAQTVLAHISQLFIERLLRQTIANQTQREQEKHGANSHLLLNNLEHIVTSLDIRNTVSTCAEFDFLTNFHLGIRNQTPKNE